VNLGNILGKNNMIKELIFRNLKKTPTTKLY
jgi:hypothetical protein